MPSNELKLAVKYHADQGQVWNSVAETQQRLTDSLGVPVTTQASETSLELSLENEELQKQTRAYTEALAKAPGERNDVVGIVVSVNGRIESADVYASPRLFRRLWPKLLEAAATEAIAARRESAEVTPPTIAAVQAFLASPGERAKTTEVSKRIRVVTRESESSVSFELHDNAQPNTEIHTSYLKKAE